MLKTTGILKLNQADLVCYDSPDVSVSAIALYTDGIWNINAIAKISNSSLSATKEYMLPLQVISSHDSGDGHFAANLGNIIEGFIMQDLIAQSPEGLQIDIHN